MITYNEVMQAFDIAIKNVGLEGLKKTSLFSKNTSKETEQLPADAGRIGYVVFQVLKYDVFGDGPVGG